MHLALVLHELATNARKYGALSVPAGRLSVRWEVRASERHSLLLIWEESNGPPVNAPRARGFGSTLIERTLSGHGGEVSIQYNVVGLTCHITLPLSDHSPANREVTRDHPDGWIETPNERLSLKDKRIMIVGE